MVSPYYPCTLPGTTEIYPARPPTIFHAPTPPLRPDTTVSTLTTSSLSIYLSARRSTRNSHETAHATLVPGTYYWLDVSVGQRNKRHILVKVAPLQTQSDWTQERLASTGFGARTLVYPGNFDGDGNFVYDKEPEYGGKKEMQATDLRLTEIESEELAMIKHEAAREAADSENQEPEEEVLPEVVKEEDAPQKPKLVSVKKKNQLRVEFRGGVRKRKDGENYASSILTIEIPANELTFPNGGNMPEVYEFLSPQQKMPPLFHHS